MNIESLSMLSRQALLAGIRDGHPIDPAAIADTEYRGTSLGLPALVERLTWKTFRKAFYRDPATGELRGWNVRMQQGSSPPTPMLRGGAPRTFGHYRVISARDCRGVPKGCDRGLLLDYGRIRDPLVAVNAGSVELLLGWSYVDLGFGAIGTPSFFVLEREGPLTYVASGATGVST